MRSRIEDLTNSSIAARQFLRTFSGAMLAICPIVLGCASIASAQVACSALIKSCGCSITSPGVYVLQAKTAFSESTNSDCISIGAKNVVLILNGDTVSGPGASKSSGAGVHVKAASQVFIEGLGATISGFKYGIWNTGASVVIEDLTASGNDTAGFYFFKAKGGSIANVDALNNGGYGIWLSASSAIQVANALVKSNTLDGILVGCMATGDKCTSTGGSSKQNVIFGSMLQQNGASGMTVQVNADQNQIGRNSASGNASKDFIDAHSSGCASNIWFANSGSFNKSCVD